MSDKEVINRILAAEKQEVDNFIRLYQVPGFDFNVMINHRWNALDMLAHLVAWHENFALNLELLAPWRSSRQRISVTTSGSPNTQSRYGDDQRET